MADATACSLGTVRSCLPDDVMRRRRGVSEGAKRPSACPRRGARRAPPPTGHRFHLGAGPRSGGPVPLVPHPHLGPKAHRLRFPAVCARRRLASAVGLPNVLGLPLLGIGMPLALRVFALACGSLVRSRRTGLGAVHLLSTPVIPYASLFIHALACHVLVRSVRTFSHVVPDLTPGTAEPPAVCVRSQESNLGVDRQRFPYMTRAWMSRTEHRDPGSGDTTHRVAGIVGPTGAGGSSLTLASTCTPANLTSATAGGDEGGSSGVQAFTKFRRRTGYECWAGSRSDLWSQTQD